MISVGIVRNSLGLSIASIGLPAVIVPISGLVATFSFFSIYSYGTNISKHLFLDFPFLIYPFFSNLFR